ncbi:Osmotically inducible protein [Labilithrix luteola]|uniref:Osmotically inducible protein n=1 Tax=Labilithrix luteola TaxID=1391654 RepID=A0A0K1QDQ0_9BACT|nr:OsmC family protein [Labilithrix luteola]AKV03889.1 Osmotically inducible protein [Labilithrix luteola]
MIRKSTAVWKGDGLHGKGALTTQSGVFKDQPYSFNTRFQSEDGKAGTNPEELVGAAHAGCFAMALGFALTDAGNVADELRVTASVDLQKDGEGFSIKHITLDLEAKVPGIDAAKFQTIAEAAKKNCPLSKALASTPMTLNAKLV